MDLAFYNNNKYTLNYQNEVTKKIVRKILKGLCENKQGKSPGTVDYSRKKIVDYFAEAELLFTLHDLSQSGEVEIELFPQMARQLKQVYDAPQVWKFKKEMNVKKIHKMNLPMFLTLLKRKLFQVIDADETFDKHFNVLDMQKKNTVDLDVLRTYLGLVGDKISPEDFDFFVKYNTEGKRGAIPPSDDPTRSLAITAGEYRDMLTCYQHI
ncbi:hypothetical protein C922_04236 [Plasmodium inui San Antonio 1]|uniref:EF-hand domain-containing protein n=1 Tax=Plasmodium inui San Antonio 1 TaxID=1237626 RepID=W7A1P8_9APIC|nr:hypothetical protein C922_04236 [Plasmodium inui San Antonio 1]EUD65293.1 hypothetical protein C922_04236 [Plasmodium inui San Antonio 1]